jgi:hypothetical protein
MTTEDKDRLRSRLREQPPPRQLARLRQVLHRYLGSAVAKIVALIGFLVAVGGLWSLGALLLSAYQNTVPEITARDSETESTFLLPFIIQNKSGAFDMKDVELTCGVGAFILGNGKQTMFQVAGLVSSQKNAIIAAGHQINFPCDASGLVKFEGAKGIDILGLHADLPGIEPMKVVGIQTALTVKYETLGKTRTYHSDPFDWTCTAQACHWTKGPTIH